MLGSDSGCPPRILFLRGTRVAHRRRPRKFPLCGRHPFLRRRSGRNSALQAGTAPSDRNFTSLGPKLRLLSHGLIFSSSLRQDRTRFSQLAPSEGARTWKTDVDSAKSPGCYELRRRSAPACNSPRSLLSSASAVSNFCMACTAHRTSQELMTSRNPRSSH